MIKKCVTILAILAITAAYGLALAATHTINVTAEVPSSNGMTVTISRVVGTVFTELGANDTMDFGLLNLDPVNHIFTAPHYFAVEVGIDSNAASWSIAHTPSSIYNRTTGITSQNLDGNVNVTFINQTSDTTEVALPDNEKSFGASTKTYTNANFPTGWLRIYYGIGTGLGDNAGVTPIPATKTAGSYQGSVQIVLTP